MFVFLFLVITHGENCLATCLGHRYGTGCYHRSRSTQKRDNWELWQLCYNCARKLHPEYYEDKKHHGVRKAREPENTIPFGIEEMPA